jgi:hypothetical protein
MNAIEEAADDTDGVDAVGFHNDAGSRMERHASTGNCTSIKVQPEA